MTRTYGVVECQLCTVRNMFSRRATCWRFLPELSISRKSKTTATSAAVFPQISISLSNDAPPHPRIIASRKTFEKARQFALGGGGEKGNAKHVHVNKKVLPRERISRILDENASFLELSQQAGLGMEYGDVPNACVIAGVGPVHGQLCMVSDEASFAKLSSVIYFKVQ